MRHLPLSALAGLLLLVAAVATAQTAPMPKDTTKPTNTASSPAPTTTASGPRPTATGTRPLPGGMNFGPRPRAGAFRISGTETEPAPPPPDLTKPTTATKDQDWFWFGVAAVAVLLAVAGTLLVMRRTKPPEAAPPSSYDPYA